MSPNPFSHDIVRTPQDSLVTVSTLNRPVLDSLLAAFSPLLQAPAPRPAVPVPKAQLVLSPAPGFGKSHLIARLSADLADRATVISFSPFQAAGLCWQSLLLQVVKALHSPAAPSGKTRLALLAEDVFRHLLAQALREGRLHHDHPAEAISWVLNYLTVEPVEDERNWNPWMHRQFSGQSATWRSILAGYQIHLDDDDWLAVLFRYAGSAEYSDAQQHCLAWLRGQGLSPETRAELGLSAHSAPGPESGNLEALNDLCRRRLRDLCLLAAFHRPFLFCFDQTEVFAQNPNLARTFGRVVAGLVNEFPQQMTVVTANQGVWDQTTRHAMDEADFHRFQTALHLRELNRQEGEELIGLLTRPYADQAVPMARMTDPVWLSSLFPNAGGEMPAREFLHRCQSRWDHAEPVVGPGAAGERESAGGSTARASRDANSAAAAVGSGRKNGPSLASRLDELLLPLAANPKVLSYDPDLFRWLAGTVLARPDECGAVENPDGFAELLWRLPQRAVLRFGFAHAASDSYSLWRQLAEYAQENERRDQVPVSKLILFRTPDLQHCPIPRESWKANAPLIRSARNSCLHLVELSAGETAELQAARQLHLEAQAGGFENFSAREVLEFLAEKLVPWRDRLLAPLNPVVGSKPANTENPTDSQVPALSPVRFAGSVQQPKPQPQAQPAPSKATAPRPVPKPDPATRPAPIAKTTSATTARKPPLQPEPQSTARDSTPPAALAAATAAKAAAASASESPASADAAPEVEAAPSALPPRILEILKAEKFLSLDALSTLLGGGISSAQALDVCRGLREIEIQSSSANPCTLLIWQG